MQRERRTFADDRLQLDRSRVVLHARVDHREAEARALIALRREERLEHARFDVRRHARARVGDRETDAAGAPLGRDPDGATSGRVSHRVVEIGREDLSDTIAINTAATTKAPTAA